MDSLKTQGCKFLKGRKVTDMLVTGETNCISEVVCEKESFVADAVIFAVGVSTLQEIIQNRYICPRLLVTMKTHVTMYAFRSTLHL